MESNYSLSIYKRFLCSGQNLYLYANCTSFGEGKEAKECISFKPRTTTRIPNGRSTQMGGGWV